MDNLSPSLFFNYSQNINTRGDKYKIFVTRSQTNIRQHTLIRRSVNNWNDLKFDTKDAGTLNQFKNSLDRELKHLTFDFDE